MAKKVTNKTPSRKRSVKSNVPEKKVSGLADPYPHAPSKTGKYCVYYYPVSDGTKKIGVQVWNTLYAAKRLVDTLIDGRDVSWKTSNEIDVDGLSIKCDHLEDIMEYDYANDAERDWQLSPDELRSALHAAGKVVEKKRDDADEPKREKRERTERKPRASREGLVSVQDMANELGVQPRDCRVVLRKLKLPKPDAGWAWPKGEAKEVMAQLKKGLKK